jgi:tRNA threonylcarbamoyladenosine biosynthesis protein TsaB
MILALEAAGPVTRMWLFQAESTPETGCHDEWESGRELSDHLLSRMTSFIQSNGAALTDLTGLIVFSGPGSFTSLRIGHTTVNALADTLGIPVVGVQGESWLKDGARDMKKAQKGQIAMPLYGAEAHITMPKS